MNEFGGSRANLHSRMHKAVTSWPLKRWVSLIGLSLTAVLLLRIPIGIMEDMDPRPEAAVRWLTGALIFSAFLFVVSLVVSFIISHVVFFRRKRTHVNRVLSRNVLLTVYVFILFFAAMKGMDENAPAYLKALRPAAVILIFGGMSWFALVMLGFIRPFSNPNTPERLDFYDSLPDAVEYIQQQSVNNRVACHKCNSAKIHQFGLAYRSDERRVFKCMICNTWLYRSYGHYS